MEKIFFVADVHLNVHNPRKSEIFLEFLDYVEKTGCKLFILGDLFDIWYVPGYRKFPRLKKVLDRLKVMRDNGIEVVFFNGNRDYLAQKYLKKEIGMKVYSRGHTFSLQDRKVYICHGDQLCLYDRIHLITSQMFRSKLVVWLLLRLPPSVIAYLTHGYERYSGRLKKKTPEKVWKLAVSAIRERFKRGADTIICGHIHKNMRYVPKIRANGLGEVYVVGKWDEEFPYLVMHDNAIKLGRFKSNQHTK